MFTKINKLKNGIFILRTFSKLVFIRLKVISDYKDGCHIRIMSYKHKFCATLLTEYRFLFFSIFQLRVDDDEDGINDDDDEITTTTTTTTTTSNAF